jgi:hypothetical protein
VEFARTGRQVLVEGIGDVGEDHERAHDPRITIHTVRPLRGTLLRMAISMLAIVVIWLLVLFELHDAISS